MKFDKELDKLLDDWELDFKEDPLLEERARYRIRSQKGRQSSLLRVLARPLNIAIAAAAMIAIGVGLSQLWDASSRPTDTQYIVIYRSTIDPLYRLSTTEGFERQGSNDFLKTSLNSSKALLWLESELHLEKPQTNRFSNLHESYEESLNLLFVQLTTLRQNYDEFETLRHSENPIDFLAYYDLLQNQKAIREQSVNLTEEIILKISTILDTNQQIIFKNLIKEELPPPTQTHHTNA
tara:strand:- start:590 stop:1300 length:711 start_codon:yes stop_codon:yes gene_type:complete